MYVFTGNESDGWGKQKQRWVGGRGGGGGKYLLSFTELLIQVGDLLSETGKFWCRESRESQLQAVTRN